MGPGKQHGSSWKGKRPMDEKTVERILELKRVREGDTKAIIFAAKTLLKDWVLPSPAPRGSRWSVIASVDSLPEGQ